MTVTRCSSVKVVSIACSLMPRLRALGFFLVGAAAAIVSKLYHEVREGRHGGGLSVPLASSACAACASVASRVNETQPRWTLQWVAESTPLARGVVALLDLGAMSPNSF
jgi:hypothetical protein